MARRRHPKKEIEDVLVVLENLGWRIELRGTSHTWGLLKCPKNSSDCRCGQYCQMSIFSTPKNPSTHAAKLKQKAMGCTMPPEEENQNEPTI